jgi:hypothetical protein
MVRRTLLAALVLASLTASPTAAQREPTDGALTYATAAYRSREPVSKVAPELRSKYRQSGEALARTLLSAGYAAPDVAAHLVSTDREPAGATVAWLAGAGIDSRLAWDAVSRATREPPEKVAAETMERIGPMTAAIMVTWGRTFQTAGLSAGQVDGIYRRVGATDPKQTAQALKDSGYSATEIAEAMTPSSPAATIFAVLYEIGFSAAEVARAARDALGMELREALEATLEQSTEAVAAERAAATAKEYGATAEEAAEELNVIGVVLSVIMTVVAIVLTVAAAVEGLAALAIPQLITVVAVVLGLGALSDKIAEILHNVQVPVDRAVAALVAHLPIDEATHAIRAGYDASAQTTANALATAGEAWPDVVEAVFDAWGSFEATAGAVPSDRINAPDVMAALFEVFSASVNDSNRDKVSWLMKAGMTADNIAKGLRDTIGLDAAAIAQLFVDAGVSSPTAIANALAASGFTQPLDVAQALKDAGFSLDQVQAALMAAFTLSMQQLAQILSAVFGG